MRLSIRWLADKILHWATRWIPLSLLRCMKPNLNGSTSPGCSSPDEKVRPAMQDVTMVLFTVVFFALAFLYVKACQKLR